MQGHETPDGDETSDREGAPDPEADLRVRVERFLQRNFPQIGLHGGNAFVEGVDLETGEVWVELGGACSGCGISPMTVAALQHRLVAEIPEIREVHANASTDDAFSHF